LCERRFFHGLPCNGRGETTCQNICLKWKLSATI